MTASASESSAVNIVFCLNSDYDNAMQVSTQSTVSDGYVYFTMQNKESAKLFASCVENSKYGINLVQEGDAVTVFAKLTTLGKVVCAVLLVILGKESWLTVVVNRHFAVCRYSVEDVVGLLVRLE